MREMENERSSWPECGRRQRPMAAAHAAAFGGPGFMPDLARFSAQELHSLSSRSLYSSPRSGLTGFQLKACKINLDDRSLQTLPHILPDAVLHSADLI